MVGLGVGLGLGAAENGLQPEHVSQLHLLSHSSELLAQNDLQGGKVGFGVGAGVGGSRQKFVAAAGAP